MLRAFCNGAVFGDRVGSEPARVVALHGWGRDRADLLPCVDGLDAVSLDLPGFGSSPAPESVWGGAEYSRLIAEVIREISEDPVVVVGHSFGGRVAVCLAAASPELVAGLVLTGTPLLRPDRPEAKAHLGYRVVKRLNRIGLVHDDRLEQAKQKHGSADYRNAGGVMRDILVRAVNETYENELRKIACPVELVWGELDTAAPLDVAERATEMLANANLTVVRGGSHDTPIRAPEELRARIDHLLLERAR